MIYLKNRVRDDFWKKPPLEYRPLIWWSWNDRLDKEEVYRQIKGYAQNRFGGVFMHARTGLATSYLSDEWMSIIKYAVSIAKANHLQANLYDEDRWPSGFGGGRVAEIHPDKPKKAVVYDKETNSIQIISAPSSPWWNGSFPPDLLQKEVTKTFIKVTYEKYKKWVGKYFGKTMAIAFTDEPSFYIEPFELVEIPQERIPWSDAIVPAFKQRYGYDIRKQFRKLFFDEGNYHQIRYQFYRLMTEKFRDSYFKPIYNWCAKNNIKLTGHLLKEETLAGQTQTCGAVMPHYEYIHIPAIDHLGTSTKNMAMVVKQVSSAANQLGKERVLCEIYGGSGWGVTFKELKHSGEFNYVLGINLMCQHLSYYSTRGCRKYDWPPSFSYHQPYWKEFWRFNDYFARLSYMLTRGERVCRVLLFHPIASAWSDYTPLNPTGAGYWHKKLNHTVNELLSNQIDFDFGDEILIERYGRIKDKVFCIGKAFYDIVIVPPSLSWNGKVMDKIENFLEKGGKAIWLRPIPGMIDGRVNSRIKLLVRHKNSIISDINRLVSVLSSNYIDDIKIEGKDRSSILCQHRRTDNEDIYYLVNNDINKVRKVTCLIQGGSVEQWDPYTGESKRVGVSNGQRIRLGVSFESAGSRLLVVPRNRIITGAKAIKSNEKKSNQRKISLNGPWVFEKLSPNVLMIEYARYRFGEGQWSKVVPAYSCPAPWNFQDAVDKIGMKGPIPWNISLHFVFYNALQNWKDKKIYFCLEDMDKYKSVKVNGREIIKRPKGRWLDQCISKVKITDTLVQGINNIIIKGNYHRSKDYYSYRFSEKGLEFERCYIIGDFAVEAMPKGTIFKIVKEKRSGKVGVDLSVNGYPFFVGGVRLSNIFHLSITPPRKVFLCLDRLETEMVKIFINGKEIKALLWEWERVELGEVLKKGKNTIAIELINTLWPIWGNHHYPAVYNDPSFWKDKYSFKKFGLLKRPDLWMKTELNKEDD